MPCSFARLTSNEGGNNDWHSVNLFALIPMRRRVIRWTHGESSALM